MGILGELSPSVRAGLLRPDGEPTALHRALIVEPSDLLLDKPRYGAFHGTDLDLILRSRRIDTVIIAGIATNICCDTTAREAAMRDLRVIFLSDGTATGGAATLPSEVVQSATLATLDGVFGQVLSIEQATRKIEQGGQI
jgi:ureidoacrylate peracid hydrolase